ncbi:MAG TPA: aminotransferase class III-fold pyridoxal phosphate-dependent enzyme [Gemmatimonadaceae bacterium]|nr:aminotransferase class III-fold pyridoxal phosphate-dependent enzyme [Gemmatimonadaceae bacterium]
MVFRKIFGGGRPGEPASAPEVERESPDADPQEDAIAEEAPWDDAESEDRHDWRARALEALPTGASTGSKRPGAIYGEGGEGPTHFVRASGCTVTDPGGATYIDCTMALGAVALGYGEKRVVAAVAEAAARGNVAGLSPVEEVEIAERLCDLVPCGEQAVFLKSGAEAVSAAVRVARTYTGRDVVVASGYFGWHDWASDARGVPASAHADVVRIPFDDVAALERAVDGAGSRLAAIVLEPVIERLPSDGWVKRARDLADRAGAVLVFDELKTGFRLRPAGYQELSGVTPDLAAFGKAMANGFPLAAVVGRRDVMQAARDTWISSTLASESVALAAAGAVLDWHVEADICATLWDTGAEIRARVGDALDASGCTGVELLGIDPMWLMRWDDPAREALFLSAAAEAGVLFKRGAYNYAAIAHDDAAIIAIERAASEGFIAVRDAERDA